MKLLAHFAFLNSICACTSTAPNALRDAYEYASLSSQTGLNELEDCQATRISNWDFPGRYRNLRIVRQDGQAVLLYEAVGATAVRTVWQPLDSDFNFAEEGVLVGNPKHPHTIDFNVQSDPIGNTWAWYRFKVNGSEAYSAGIEFVEKNSNKMSQYPVSLPADLSVQQIWAMHEAHTPPSTDSTLHLVLKAYPSESFDSAEAHYLWFEIRSSQPSPLLKGRYLDGSGNYQSAQFFFDPAAKQPYAIALYQREPSVFSEKPGPASDQQVILETLFSSKRQRIILFRTSRSVLGSLQAKTFNRSGQNILTAAWVNQIATHPSPYLQWVSIKLGANGQIPDIIFAHQSLNDPAVRKKASLGQHFLKLKHLPANLHFRLLKDAQGRDLTYLAWLASLDRDIVYMSTPVFPASSLKPVNGSSVEPKPSSRHAFGGLRGLLVKDTNVSSQGLSEFSDPSGSTVILYTAQNAETNGGLTGNTGRQPPVHLCTFQMLRRQTGAGAQRNGGS